ncbi:TolB family protein [Niabella sp. CJ426]|uniref:TolB family protein n=1 Tax=Niabella sp. CJ426 TaxID=3393740 RepID=UPI003D078F0C
MSRFFIFVLSVLLIFLQSNIAVAQQFGGNPTGMRWKQINTDTARIIFPEGFDTAAQRVASFISRVSLRDQLSLGKKLKKIDIILQNQPVITNGYVSMGPFRSEFYTTPSPDNYDPSSLSWLTQLTVHEYRHVQQYNNFNNGLSAVMKKLFGQEGYALAVNAAVPNWFFEGDAVYSESLLAPHGRGTLPFFLKAFPALWQSGKDYSWMKIRNGSLKDYVPNHYDLGYLLVNYGSRQYGYDFWRKVTRDASAYRGLFYPLQQAVQRHSGISYKDFRQNAFNYYKAQYQLENPGMLADSLNVFASNTKTLTQYSFPFQLSETDLLYQKSSNNQRTGFYIRGPEGERLLRLRDISIEDQYSYRNGKIVYAAYESHPRWRWVSYNVIKLLDVATGQQRTLTHQSRYFSPDISADGKTIVANSVSLDGRSALTFLTADNGNPFRTIVNDSISYFSNPKFLNDSTIITVLRNKDATTAIAAVDILSGSIKNITPPSSTVIGNIAVNNGKIYFTASKHLKDELFYYDLAQQQLFQLPTPGVGSYFASSDFNKLNWSVFTADGFQLQQADEIQAQWQPLPMEAFVNNKTGIVSDSIHASYQLMTASPTHAVTQPYRKLTHPFNFHSWRPNYSDPEFSFTIYGNNILNTTETQLYYVYNENDKTHTAGGAVTYGGLFPYISLGSNYTFDRRAVASKKLRQWNEWNNYIGASIPLSWASNRTYKVLNIGSNYYYRTDFNTGPTKNEFKELQFSYLAHGVSWTQQVQTTTQDIYPKWGYSVNTQFRHALNLYDSWQGYAGAALYLPGLARAHSLVLNGALQYSGSEQRVFGNRTAFARGYAGRDSAGIYAARANYHFPVFYPDWGFANILYLQRIRANVFYDYTQALNKSGTRSATLQSTGAEICMDTKWWNQHSLTFGFRAGYLLTAVPGQDRKMFFEFILPTNLIPR